MGNAPVDSGESVKNSVVDPPLYRSAGGFLSSNQIGC
jgi:hypothetical protein